MTVWYVGAYTRRSSTQTDINQVSHWYNNSPDDGHMAARNMYRIEINIHKKLCVRLVMLLHTRRSSTKSDMNQMSHWYNNSPDDGHMAARNMYRIEINIHEKLCVKLVIYKDHTGMHGQQNIKKWRHVIDLIEQLMFHHHPLDKFPVLERGNSRSHPYCSTTSHSVKALASNPETHNYFPYD